jgi:hypothetical protein
VKRFQVPIIHFIERKKWILMLGAKICKNPFTSEEFKQSWKKNLQRISLTFFEGFNSETRGLDRLSKKM